MRSRSASPMRSCLAGYARVPLTCTFPPAIAAEASARVLKKRAAHSQRSRRTLSAVMPKGIINGHEVVARYHGRLGGFVRPDGADRPVYRSRAPRDEHDHAAAASGKRLEGRT